MSEIVMPRLSDTMEEGTVLRWLKRDGEHVHRGEELVEIETDKAAMVYESDQEGLLQIVAQEGDTLPVGAPIAHVGEGNGPAGGPSVEPTAAADAVPAPVDSSADASVHDSERLDSPPADTLVHEGEQLEVAPVDAVVVGDDHLGELDVLVGEGLESPAVDTPVHESERLEPLPADTSVHQHEQRGSPLADTPVHRGEQRVKASPLARRIARESGVDLHDLMGTGPGGRIVKADVEAAGMTAAGMTAAGTVAPRAPSRGDVPVPEGASPHAPPGAPADIAERVATAKGETTIVELTRTQQTIARRMSESKATIPDFALHMEIDMERCVALRNELKRLSPEQAPTYNDMVVKACALALHEHPRANGSYRDGKLQLHSRVNVGVAVAVHSDDPMGGALVVPTVFDAALKSLGEIARETLVLAARVRAGTITPPELGGGTFTVSNLGMYGVRSFTAIVNPPQAGILSVGSLEPRPVVREGEIVACHTMSVTLACDHRILYGADAARFLARVRELLEEPAALAL